MRLVSVWRTDIKRYIILGTRYVPLSVRKLDTYLKIRPFEVRVWNIAATLLRALGFSSLWLLC